MLVLSRKAQQTIRIGDSITVTILNVKGTTVRIGIDAPREIRVIRGELPVFTTDESEEATHSRPVAGKAAGAGRTDGFDDETADVPDEILPHRYAVDPADRLHPLRDRAVTRPR